MAFITKVLGKILGNKSERDIKEITPIVEKIKEEYKRIAQLSNDGLREESDKLKNTITEFIKPENDEIDQLKKEIDVAEIQEAEKLYEKIDKLEERINEKIEEVLNEICQVLKNTKNLTHDDVETALKIFSVNSNTI